MLKTVALVLVVAVAAVLAYWLLALPVGVISAEVAPV